MAQWTFRKPRAWQESGGVRTPVDARFVAASEAQARFQVSAFDRTRPLYIDVELSGNYLDTSPRSRPASFAVDASNSVYFSGATFSTAECGPTGGGGFIYCSDAFVAAFRPNGEPIFLTVLAGRVEDWTTQVALDSNSNIILAGNTTSADFPVTPGAFQPANAGPLGPRPRLARSLYGDLFLARLHPRTGELLSSTFFGGPEGEEPQGLAIGPDDSVTVLATGGKGFPTTSGAWMRSSDCQTCNAVMRFGAALARPLFSSFVPFSSPAFSLRMAVHTDASVYIAGSARDGAPTAEGAFQTKNGGESDAYILRLAPDGSRPLFASFFGGAGTEFVDSLAVDSRGDAWLHGDTWEGYPQGAPRTSWLIRVRGDGAQVTFPEFFPGVRIASARLLIDSDGRLLLSGASVSPVLPTTADALLRAGCGNGLHHYLEQREADGSLRFATYLPGNSTDLVLAPSGGLYRLYPDRIERVDLRTPAKFSLACVTDAASRRNSALPVSDLPGRVSPGEIITLVGSRLGPETGVSADPTQAGRYPTSLAGVRVLIGNTPAPLLYVQASQINAAVPYAITPGKPIDVAVEHEGRTSAVQVATVPAEFSLFTVDGSGIGQAAALNEDGTLNAPSNPARRGSIVALYGTGTGITVPPSADGALAPVAAPDGLPKPAGQILVRLAPWAEVVYAGAAPGLVNGLTQINLRVLETLPENIHRLDVAFWAGNARPGNYATIAVQ